LSDTKRGLGDFNKSMRGFCDLMNKEMSEITKRLEDLKTKLIDQERK
jgi:hypothetical protein